MANRSNTNAAAVVERLRAWLSLGHPIPMRRGRVNRAELCRSAGLTRSTLGSNSRLKAIVASLEPVNRPPFAPQKTSVTPEQILELEALRQENAALKRQLLAVSWLLDSGRCVHL